MDAPYVCCTERTCGCRTAASVRRSEHRGNGTGKIDDSLLHDSFIDLFCGPILNEHTEIRRLILIYALQYLRDRKKLLRIAFYSYLANFLITNQPSDSNSNPNYLYLLIACSHIPTGTALLYVVWKDFF